MFSSYGLNSYLLMEHVNLAVALLGLLLGLLLAYRYKLKDRTADIKDEDKNKKDKTKTKKLFSKPKDKQVINGIRNRKNETQDEKMGLLQSKESPTVKSNEKAKSVHTAPSADEKKPIDLCNGSTDILDQQKYSSLERKSFLSEELTPNINRSIKRQSSLKLLHDSIGGQNIPNSEGIQGKNAGPSKENSLSDKTDLRASLDNLDKPKIESNISVNDHERTIIVNRSPKLERSGNITQLINTINSNAKLEPDTNIQYKINEPKTEKESLNIKQNINVSVDFIKDEPNIKHRPKLPDSIKPATESKLVSIKPNIYQPKIETDVCYTTKTESVIIKDITKKNEKNEISDNKYEMKLGQKLILNIPDEPTIDSENGINQYNLAQTCAVDSGVQDDTEMNIEPEFIEECYNVNIDSQQELFGDNKKITNDIINNNTCLEFKKDDTTSKIDRVVEDIAVYDKTLNNDVVVTRIANSISSDILSNVSQDLKLFSKQMVIEKYSDNLAGVIINNKLQHDVIDGYDAEPKCPISLNEITDSNDTVETKINEKNDSVIMSIDTKGNFTTKIKNNKKTNDESEHLPTIVLNDKDENRNINYSVNGETKPNVVLRRKRGHKSSKNTLSSHSDEKRISGADRPVSGYAEQLAELLADDDDLDFEFDSDEELPVALEKIKETFQDKRGISVEIGKIQRKCSTAELSEYGFKKLKSKVKSKIDDKKTKFKGDRPLSLYEQDLLSDLLGEDEDEFDDFNEVEEDILESVQSSVLRLEDKLPFSRSDRSFSNLSTQSTEEYDSMDESTKSHTELKTICNGNAPPRLGRAAVIDLGGGILKAGMCGEMEPSCYCPSVVGTPRRFSQDVSKMKKGYYVGDEAWTVAGMLQIDYPLKQYVTNWSDVTKIIEHLLDSELKVNDRGHPLMLTEKGLFSLKHREKLTEIVFETFGIPAFYLADQASLALYSMGITTGVCLNAGFACTQSTPVYEGHTIPHGSVQLDIGGDHVTKHLGRILSSSQGHSFNSSSEKLVLNSMKQSLCYVAEDPIIEEDMYKRTAGMLQTYTLPDGQEIELGTERFQAPEILFNPHTLGLNKPNTAEIIQQSLDLLDISLVPELKENIVVCGGTSKFSGFGNRLEKELALLTTGEKPYSIKYTENPLLATWIGGSVLSSIGSFREEWITIDQYADYGSSIVHKMCL